MKRVFLAAVFTASVPVEQAEAACHRYSRWFYPFPQNCLAGKIVALAKTAEPNHDPEDDQPIWYVEITKMPDWPMTSDADRDAAIQKLKEQMRR